MGNIITSKRKQQSTLLAPSIEGDLDEVKQQIGTVIARGESSLRAFVNATDPEGNAAIHGAVFAGHLDVLSFLVESCGADLMMANGLGCSPLWIASGYDQSDCLEYLIERTCDTGNLEAAMLGKNSSGDTPFLAAASRGHVQACKHLLRAAEECAKDNDCGLWMKATLLRSENKAGDTPLKVAIASAVASSSVPLEMVNLLLRADDEISPDQFGKGPTSGVEENLMLYPCVNRKNKLGLSPLIVACERNLPTIAESLLQHGADICVQDTKGRNPLAIAAFCGCNDALQFLLKQSSTKSCLLNQRDLNGCTPVWLAARTGNVSIVTLLMDAGADATIGDNAGTLPQDVAIEFKKEKVAEYFSQREN